MFVVPLDESPEFSCEAVVEFCVEAFLRWEGHGGVGCGVVLFLFFRAAFCEWDDVECCGDEFEFVVGMDDVVPFFVCSSEELVVEEFLCFAEA